MHCIIGSSCRESAKYCSKDQLFKMVGASKQGQTEPMDVDKSHESHVTGIKPDVQAYLISRYREALKTGDKSFAKSCLLSTRLFSMNDPNITNEVYVMAKADGDISEAAKCLANMFDDLFPTSSSRDSLSSEVLVVANFMKEEVRLLLNELKTQYLKLRSTPLTASNSRQVPSVSQSPLLSPRLRMSSEDRSMSRDSMLRLDNKLNASNKTLFYQQLFEHLNNDVRKRILNHAIDGTDNPFERCRLMMLAITLFHECVITYGPKLLKTLIDLSQPTTEKSVNSGGKTTRPSSMCQYAKSLLALDAIPLIFSSSESRHIELDLDELLQKTINYYSELYLENVAQEYEFEELHEGLKKTIAARILGKNIDSSTQDDTIEENLNSSLNLLFDRFLHEHSNDTVTAESLRKLRSHVCDKRDGKSISFDLILEAISELELEHDIPENILFTSGKEELSSSQTSAATPPPKARGRPKKNQTSVIVSPNDGVRRHLQNKAREALFVYSSIMQYMFNNCSKYLKQTRSRILMRFDNPLALQIETELSRAPSQKNSRGKSASQEVCGISPSKKIKHEHQLPDDSSTADDSSNSLEERDAVEPSPLNSEHSIQMDREIMDTLMRVHQSFKFLSTNSGTFHRLFSRFLGANNSDSLRWYLKIHTDCMLSSDNFEQALSSLSKIVRINQDGVKIKEERLDSSDLSTLTVATGTSAPVEAIHLRALIQSVSCHVQLLDKKNTLTTIIKLLERIKQSGLLNNDENYATGNIIDEYRILIPNETGRKEGFLFFDGLSIVRYAVAVLMDILKRYVVHSTPNSDSLIGHAIVLSQVDWPKEIPLYERCISWIRDHKPTSTTPQCLSALTKFTYPDFFNYVLDPNILEDFMALLNDGYTLDIKSVNGSLITSPGGHIDQHNGSTTSLRSSGSSTRSGKAITTRGVNKTFKEDLKVALVAQMKSSTSLIPLDLISEFIQASLVPSLMTTVK